MRVSEVMTRNVYTVREWEEVGLTTDLMSFRRFSHLPVVDAHDRPIGMISRIDLAQQASRPGNPRLLPVYDLMTRPAITISTDASLETAAGLMAEKKIHALPVIDEAGKICGIVSDSDVLATLAGRRIPAPAIGDVEVKHVMTRNPVTVDEDDDVGDAAGTMLEGNFRHLPVINADRRLVGMLSERDLRSHMGTDFRDWSEIDSERLLEPVSNIMAQVPVVVRPHNRLVDLLDIFADEGVGALPVLDDEDRLVGILSYVDVLVWLRDVSRLESRSVDTEAPSASP